MIKRILFTLICLVLMAAVPLAAAGMITGSDIAAPEDSAEEHSGEPPTPIVNDNDDISSDSTNAPPDGNGNCSTVNDTGSPHDIRSDTFRIKDSRTGSITQIPDMEFCVGALAYEMQPGFETEALKAQTVALYTFFCRKRLLAEKNGADADITADLSDGQIYLSDALLRKKWGNQYDTSIKKIKAAVKSVFGEIMADSSGEPIDACYHAISPGATENAADVFGKADPHLVSAASPYDTAAPGYITTLTLEAGELRRRLSSADSSISFGGDPSQYFGQTRRTGSGSVMRISICGKEFTGQDIRKALGLRSAAFETEYKDGKFIFTVRGYGHGAGMSQWGAQIMAQQGSDYYEILRRYYSNIRFIRI